MRKLPKRTQGHTQCTQSGRLRACTRQHLLSQMPQRQPCRHNLIQNNAQLYIADKLLVWAYGVLSRRESNCGEQGKCDFPTHHMQRALLFIIENQFNGTRLSKTSILLSNLPFTVWQGQLDERWTLRRYLSTATWALENLVVHYQYGLVFEFQKDIFLKRYYFLLGYNLIRHSDSPGLNIVAGGGRGDSKAIIFKQCDLAGFAPSLPAELGDWYKRLKIWLSIWLWLQKQKVKPPTPRIPAPDRQSKLKPLALLTHTKFCFLALWEHTA